MKIPKQEMQITEITGNPYYDNGKWKVDVKGIENYEEKAFTVTCNSRWSVDKIKVGDIIEK